MGCCSSVKDPSIQIMKQSYRLFEKIDKKKQNYIDASDISAYFGGYGDSYTKIMMREMDHNKDGMITKNQWLGYWEMVRRSGHRNSEIRKQFKEIENGELHLNFPRTQTYHSDEPRETVVDTIVQDLKRTAPKDLPFKLQKS